MGNRTRFRTILLLHPHNCFVGEVDAQPQDICKSGTFSSTRSPRVPTLNSLRLRHSLHRGRYASHNIGSTIFVDYPHTYSNTGRQHMLLTSSLRGRKELLICY